MKLGFFNDWTLGVVKNDTHIVDVSEALAGCTPTARRR